MLEEFLERIAVALENLSFGGVLVDTALVPNSTPQRYVIHDWSQNGQAPMFQIELGAEYHEVNWNDKKLIPNGTEVRLLKLDFTPALVIRRGQIDDLLPGFDRGTLENDLSPKHGWYLEGTPTYGAHQGETIRGIVLNDIDTDLLIKGG